MPPRCCSSLQHLFEHGRIKQGDQLSFTSKHVPNRGADKVPPGLIDLRQIVPGSNSANNIDYGAKEKEWCACIVQNVPAIPENGVYEGRQATEEYFTEPTAYARFAVSLRDDLTLRKYLPHLNGWKDVSLWLDPKGRKKETLSKVRQSVDKEETAMQGGEGASATADKLLMMAPGSQWQRVLENGATYYWQPFTNEVQVDPPKGFLGVDLEIKKAAVEAVQATDSSSSSSSSSSNSGVNGSQKKRLKGEKAKRAKGRGGGKSKKSMDLEPAIVAACEQWTEQQLETWLRHTLRNSGTPMQEPVPTRIKGMLAAFAAVKRRRAVASGLAHYDMDAQAEQLEIDCMIEMLDL